MGENVLKNTSHWPNFCYGANFSPKIWRGGENILAEICNGAVVQWRKDFKSGARRGGAN